MPADRAIGDLRVDRAKLPGALISNLLAVALSIGLPVVSPPGWAAPDVYTTGDANPVIVSTPAINLAGTNLLLGRTIGGIGQTGDLYVLDGGALTIRSIATGAGGLGTGFATISGAGSIVTIDRGVSSSGSLDIGSWGTGTMSVTAGAKVVCLPTNCLSNKIGNGAGSTGKLTIDGVGSSVKGLESFTVGYGTVDAGFGTASATTTATLEVKNGAVLETGASAISRGGPFGPLATGAEHTVATVTIDGTDSAWQITRNPAAGAQAQLTIAPSTNAIATIDVKNGGQLVITGSRTTPLTDNSVPGISMSGTGTTAGTLASTKSTLNVTGPGSAVVINGDTGFFNLGRNLGTAHLNITDGGTVSGGGTNGFVNMNVARAGSNATLSVDGAGSQLTLSGICGVNTGCDDHGAFLSLGRDTGSVATATVTGGGKILVRDGGQAAVGGGLGILIGWNSGSGAGSGSLTVSGAASRVTVDQTGAGTTIPFITVGQAGTGTLTVTDGAKVAVNGTIQRNFVVGNSVGGSGTLNMSTGAEISASWLGIGINGGIGTATINDAAVKIDGYHVSADSTVSGGSIRIGRGLGSTGTMNLASGAQVTINTAIANASVNLGGTGDVNFGDGILNMSGGSSIKFTGTGATPHVTIGHTGTGVVTMTGASLIDLPSDGAVTIGSHVGATGALTMTGGSVINAGAFFGIGHTRTDANVGTATVIINGGSSVNAAACAIGAGGTLGGTFKLKCDTTLENGAIDPANSPGRGVIDGAFNVIGGTIILEIESDGAGGFLTDEIVFSAGHALDLSGLDIQFSFLGNTDPNAFYASGDWVLDTFFKTNFTPGLDESGDVGISALLVSGQTLDDLFADVMFNATSDVFVFQEFVFSPNDGVIALVAVPEPATLALMLLGCLALIAGRQRSARHLRAA